MAFSKKVNDILSQRRLTKAQLSKAVDIPYTTLDSMLKRDSDTKRLSLFFRIADFLGVTVEYLISDDEEAVAVETEAEVPRLTDEESRLIDVFKKLDRRGRAAVLSLAELEAGFSPDEDDASHSFMRRLIVYDAPAAAGMALPFMTDDYTELFTSEAPLDATYGIKIRGDSMEPLIADNSVVWVKQQTTLNAGEIGIFILNDESLCKRLAYRGGRCFLMSENRAYSPIEILDTDELRVAGKVLQTKLPANSRPS